jgi:drug/metabolite transporter (DMT)-like permease
MAVVNRSLPATTTSLGILATPVIGVITSSLALGETVDITLLVAMAMILAGIAVGTIPAARRAETPMPRPSVESVVRP